MRTGRLRLACGTILCMHLEGSGTDQFVVSDAGVTIMAGASSLRTSFK